jgi:hypothetical protein
MADENGKKEAKVITYIDPVTEPGPDDIVTHIGESRGASTKYGVVFPVMIDEEFLKERYNMTLLEMVQAGVRQISTRPSYDAAFLADGTVDHAKLQKIADDYKPGNRQVAGPKVTKEQAKLGRAVAKEASGLTQEEIMAAIAAAKAKKGL